MINYFNSQHNGHDLGARLTRCTGTRALSDRQLAVLIIYQITTIDPLVICHNSSIHFGRVMFFFLSCTQWWQNNWFFGTALPLTGTFGLSTEQDADVETSGPFEEPPGCENTEFSGSTHFPYGRVHSHGHTPKWIFYHRKSWNPDFHWSYGP